MNARSPEIAVIVPARNAAATLPATLEALSRQEIDAAFEVLVVDDASTDGTGDVVRAHGARLVAGPGAGPAEARNAGVAATSAELLAFTDADCMPALAWLRSGLDALRAGADLVQGPIRPVRPAGGWDRTLHVTDPSPLFESANLFVRRETFEAAGGFERPHFLPESVPHFGEDVVFGWRAVRAGARVSFAPDAIVQHEVFPRGPRGFVAEKLRLRLFPPLVKEVPELRKTMPLGLFLSGRTMRADLAFAGVVIAWRLHSPLPLVGAAPYIWKLWPQRPWKRGLARYNAVQVTADLVGFASLAWGSARHRAPVL